MKDEQLDERSAIAIIGMACRFPGADTPEQFWRNVCDGVCSIRRLEDEELAARGVSEATRKLDNYVKVFSGPADVDKLDAAFFGITPSEAECMDPQHRMLLECAHEALERANVAPGTRELRVGMFGGVGVNGYTFEHLYSLLPDPFNLASGRFSRDMHIGLGNEKCYACTRISHKLDLRGPSLYVDAACATSLVAVHLACKSLLDYECDAAVAGGSKIEIPYELGYLYEQGGMTSPAGEIRAFDAGAQGTLFASGAAAVVLKRLEDARRDGDDIVAVIRGSAINNDGAEKAGFTAPSYDGQRNVILEALTFSGVDVESIEYVETHGTGTPLGDPIEIAALTAAYRTATPRRGYCAVGSLKPNIGHIEAASGVAGLMKAALAVRHGVIPPSLNYETPNPQIDFDSSPFFVNTRLREWHRADGPRRAGVSSFGVGGTNAHVIIEQHVGTPGEQPGRSHQLLLWSAKTEKALQSAGGRLADHLREYPQQPLADVAYTLARGREFLSRRRMLVCDSRESAIAGIAENSALDTAVSDGRVPDIAFLFPGQGAQQVGMCASLYREERVFRDSLDECARLLRGPLGTDLLAILYPAAGEAEHAQAQLAQTWITQPALFSVEFALAKQWQAWGIEPAAMLGHSIGEYVAACLAGVFSLEDALRLVAARGRLMQSLPEGAMLAVPLDEQELAGVAARGWDLAAVNAPKASVASGPAGAIAVLEQELAARGVECRRLRTSHAFHSAMMDPILERFAAEVARVRRNAPAKRFLSNTTGDWITDAQATSVDYWVQHLRGAVRFADGAARLLAEPGLVLLEVGPGQTLTALARQQPAAAGRTLIASQAHPRENRDAQAALLTAVGRLWLANASIDWAAFHAGEQRRRVPLPTYPYERKRYWIDPPVGMRGRRQASADRSRRDVARWFHVPGWSMAPLANSPTGDAAEARWLLFCDASGMASSLATRLRARGDEVIEVTAGARYDQWRCELGVHARFTIRADLPEDYARLIEDLASTNSMPTQIVHAWTVDPAGDDYALAQRIGFHSLVFLAQALGANGTAPVTLSVLSCGLADVLGHEPLDALKGSVLGPVKVIEREYPQIRCRHIDVLAGEMSLDSLAAELDAAPDLPAVAWRGRRRWKLEHAPLELAPGTGATLPWRQGGTYWITGGLGGLGLVFAERLAREQHARLVLSARQALPPREQWAATIRRLGADHAVSQRIAAVEKLELLGAEVLVVAADVTDRAAMRAAHAAARARFGAIHGVMHAAGIAGGGIIQRKTVEQAEAVLAPKILGAQVLLETLANERLDVVLLHSSLFAITGGAGQVDYCGANNALDLIAQQHARSGTRTLSLNWDAWSEVGMAARAAAGATPGAVPEPLLREHRPLTHPLLESFATDADGNAEFLINLDPRRQWVLDEHRMGGVPVMPGAAFVDMAISAFRIARDHSGPVELADVLFLAPLQADAKLGTRARLLLTRTGDTTSFRVQSAPADSTWRDHAFGNISAGRREPRARDLPGLADRIAQSWTFEGRERDVLPTDAWLSFGSRWQSVKQITAAGNEAQIELALPAELAGDVEQFALHPALLDLATGPANGYWLEQTSFAAGNSRYLPFGYDRISVWRDLPARCSVRVRLHEDAPDADMLRLDVSISDANGRPVAAIERFTLKRADGLPAAAPAPAARPVVSPAVKADASMFIAPGEGVDALDRILGAIATPQVIVSTRDLAQLLADMREAAAAPALAQSVSVEMNERPDVASAFAAPRNDLERSLASIWHSLLGIREVGINDNFFELGGDSLLATQIPNRVRSELSLGIDLAAVFRTPTIAGLATHLMALATPREVGTL